MRAIIILAGGRSSRFGRDKALVDFWGKPLIAHVIERLRGLATECLVIIGRNHDAENYRRVLPKDTVVIRDTVDFEGPLAGFVTALKLCKANHCFLAACDMPFIEPKIVEYLFAESSESSGAVPKWLDGRLEPLHAVYDCDAARDAARLVAEERVFSMVALIDRLPRIRFVSIEEEIAPLHPTLNTFRNLNTPRELRDLERGSNP